MSTSPDYIALWVAQETQRKLQHRQPVTREEQVAARQLYLRTRIQSGCATIEERQEWMHVNNEVVREPVPDDTPLPYGPPGQTYGDLRAKTGLQIWRNPSGQEGVY